MFLRPILGTLTDFKNVEKFTKYTEDMVDRGYGGLPYTHTLEVRWEISDDLNLQLIVIIEAQWIIKLSEIL